MKKQEYPVDLIEMLRMTAPGTALREGLDNVLRAGTGGLVVIGDEEAVLPLTRGGFHINADYSPAHLYELAKMDGAIILSADGSKILSANVHLNPDPQTPSSETGIRHRSAEQTARQTGALVISISQRRRIITLYKGSMRYVLREPNALLNTANQAIETLDKYKGVLDNALVRLSSGEFDNLVNLADVLQVIQRTEMLKRVESELTLYIVELGVESRLIKMQLDELVSGVDEEKRLTLRDYLVHEGDPEEWEEHVERAMQRLSRLNSDDLLEGERVAHILGYDMSREKQSRQLLMPKGYRLLNKIPRLPGSVVENIIDHFGDWQQFLYADIDELDEVAGIGPIRAQQIVTGLERLRAQIMTESIRR